MREFTAETRRSPRNTKIVLATDGAQMHTEGNAGNCKLRIAKCKFQTGKRLFTARASLICVHLWPSVANNSSSYLCDLRVSAVNPLCGAFDFVAAGGALAGSLVWWRGAKPFVGAHGADGGTESCRAGPGE